MKKTLLCAVISVCITVPTMAQKKGLLNKLNDKLEQVNSELNTSSGAGAEASDKELKKDMESTILDSKPILKDNRNISGIYFSKYPLRVGSIHGAKFNFAKKFLINYDDASGVNQIEITTRYFYENRKDIAPLVYGPVPGTPDYFPVTNSIKLGHLYIDGLTDKRNGVNGYMNYSMNINKIIFPLNGTPTVENKWELPGSDILELEPGILVIADFQYIVKAKTPEIYKLVQEKANYNLFYKKEKEAAALALTDAQVWDRIKKFYEPYYKLLTEAKENKTDLVKPMTGFKDEPKNADLVTAIKDRMKQMKYYGANEQLVYCYPVTSWENRYENIGIHGKTLTHRVLQVQAILKDGDKCSTTQFLIRQDNTYQAGSNAEKFGGNKVFSIGDIEKTIINCTKAMKYKK